MIRFFVVVFLPIYSVKPNLLVSQKESNNKHFPSSALEQLWSCKALKCFVALKLLFDCSNFTEPIVNHHYDITALQANQLYDTVLS